MTTDLKLDSSSASFDYHIVDKKFTLKFTIPDHE